MKIFIGITTTPNRKNYLDQLLKSIEKFANPDFDYLVVISSDEKKQGVHWSTNKLLKSASMVNFNFGFKIDDDVFIKKSGWEKLYFDFAEKTGYSHLSYKNPDWNNHNKGNSVYDSMGCFWTFTKEVIEKVGYFDVPNMGFRGIGHIDYSARCCRVGFNDENNFRDAPKSNYYIGMHYGNDYISSLSQNEILEARKNQSEKMRIARDKSRIYIPY